jgi:succinyl-CoA synthetase beta subunit
MAVSGSQQVRHLNLHEYQAKTLMATYDIRVQRGAVASTPEEAKVVADALVNDGAEELVVKAQIHAGGRGKGTFTNGFKGGVKILDGAERATEAASMAKEMIGQRLVTKQTDAVGQLCSKVLVHEGITFNRELYVAFVMDREHDGPVCVVSPQGGMDIEEVAETSPEAIHAIPIDIEDGIQPEQTAKVAAILGFEGAAAVDAAQQVANLYEMFVKEDCTQVEINPLVETANGVYCVDAKLNFDDNSEYRHKELFQQRDYAMEDPREVAASKHGLNYIGLDGNIGCMVNGAGLAMATMDIIQLHGGKPANFLDVGGGATEEQVEEAFKILTQDPAVKAILVNIFGGIMKCDVIAQGIANAAKKLDLKLPLVVRLEGTNVEAGNKILLDSGIKLTTAADLDDAAIKAVKTLH